MIATGLGDHLVFLFCERHGKILGNTKTLEAVIHPLRSYKDLDFSLVKDKNCT